MLHPARSLVYRFKLSPRYMRWYSTGSGSDRAPFGECVSVGARSLPLPVLYHRMYQCCLVRFRSDINCVYGRTNHWGHGDHGDKSSGAMIFHFLLPVIPVSPVVVAIHAIANCPRLRLFARHLELCRTFIDESL